MRRRSLPSLPGFEHSAPVPVACRIENLVVSGGIHGSDPTTGVVAETIEEQARNIFVHIRRAIEALGGGVEDIIKVNAWLADPRDRSVLNSEWTAMFPEPDSRPARHVMPGSLAPGTYIVCDFMAVLPQERT